jgi:XTP/dITP diphosphohydrolase
MDIVLATKNRKKAEELQKILGEELSNEIRILTLNDFPDCPDIKEDGKTFEENAIKKAVFISRYTGLPAIADDSGIEVDALNGAPGVFSARYAGEESNDEANIMKLLNEMKGVPDERRNARFVCCIAFSFKDTVEKFFGYIKGTIGREPLGNKGFGYDPIFYPEGSDRTFAQMEEKEKNAISHRANALRQLKKYLKTSGW